MKDLPNKLIKLGVERRFALDIGSVIAGVRPRGLIHLPIGQKQGLQQILNQYSLRFEAERTLYRLNDSTSREGVLLDSSNNESAEEWCEIWYSDPKVETVDQYELFKNPGKFLGYPQCCRDSMECENALAKLFFKYIFTDKKRYWELNRLATLFHNTILMPDFFPCSLSCDAARDFVLSFQQVCYDIFSNQEVGLAIQSMQTPISVIENNIVFWTQWEEINDGLHVIIDEAKKENLNNISSLCVNSHLQKASLIGFQHLACVGNRGEVSLYIKDKKNCIKETIDCNII
jgi:hypothetical protein